LKLAPLIALLAIGAEARGEEVFVSVEVAEAMIADGAVILDARGKGAQPPYIPNAQVIEWEDMKGVAGRSGKLGSPDEVKLALEAAGVSTGVPIVVYGAFGKGWGEEARIWWTLRYLGHREARILDGGVGAWEKAKKRIVGGPAAKPPRGSFEVDTDDELRIGWQGVDAARRSGTTQIIDSRSGKEFEGATLYWEERGGHVPGAKNLEWKNLIGSDGLLLPKKALVAELEKVGINLDKPIITYCTGGVRSSFLHAALMHIGVRAANYDASWWEYASRLDLPVEKPRRK
jgi:thiosulfate/3-mercaptopyruvate sulfurtransferase